MMTPTNSDAQSAARHASHADEPGVLERADPAPSTIDAREPAVVSRWGRTPAGHDEDVYAAIARRLAKVTVDRGGTRPLPAPAYGDLDEAAPLIHQPAGGLNHRRASWALGISLLVHACLAVGAAWVVLHPQPDVRDLSLEAAGAPRIDPSLLDGTPVEITLEAPVLHEAPLSEPEQNAESEPAADELMARTVEPPAPAEPPRPQQVEPTPRVHPAAEPTTIATGQPPERLDPAVQAALDVVIPPMEPWASGRPARTAEPLKITARKAAAAKGEPGSPGAAAPAASSITFAGARSERAESVVYAVDASGPMVTSLPMVLNELRRSVARLAPEQRFSVVLFRESVSAGDPGNPDDASTSVSASCAVFSEELLPATRENQAKLARWLASIEPAGRSNPLVGLERALTLRPQVVFLLSRSLERSGGGVWGQGLWATIDRLERLNPPVAAAESVPDAGESAPASAGRAVQIQTIAFLDDDPTGIMQSIAQRHGPRDGSGYRVVRRSEDLGSR